MIKASLASVATAAMLAVFLVGCAMQRPLFKAPMVSVTDDSVVPSRKLEELGFVSARYCRGEDPVEPGNKNVGMLDEVIHRAQTSKNARYLRDAQFYTAGNCVLVEGTALR